MSSALKDEAIGTFEELAELVQPFRKNGAWIFRGTADGKYPLVPAGEEGARSN
jgi:hypothetical protein